MRHDGGDPLQSQDHRVGLKAFPLNSMECGKFYFRGGWTHIAMLGFQSFEAAQDTLAGIELMHRIKKRQMVVEAGGEVLTAAELCYSLAA